MNKKALVIDGNSLMYRMFYATYNLAEYAINNNLVPVNAVKLVLETCLKLRNYHYDYCLVAFDHDKKTFRHDMLQDYKAGRKKMPEALVTQIPLIKESLNLIGFHTLSLPGIEADDLAGSFVKLMVNNNIHVDVYSSDKDLLQLVSPLCHLHLLKTGLSNVVINTIDNFSNLNNGLTPKQIPDYKAIVGDKSDNLQGVTGIGEKTGIDLIKKFGSLQNIYNKIDELTTSQQKKFIACKEMAFLCKQLATIDTTVFDSNYFIDNFVLLPFQEKETIEFLRKYKINGLEKYFKKQMNIFN